jgi:hypothetical protein
MFLFLRDNRCEKEKTLETFVKSIMHLSLFSSAYAGGSEKTKFAQFVQAILNTCGVSDHDFFFNDLMENPSTEIDWAQ